MQNQGKHWRALRVAAVAIGVVLSSTAADGLAAVSNNQDQPAAGALTPLQLEIEKQRLRLASAEIEERREAVTRLGSMHHPKASRAALAALNDPAPICPGDGSGSDSLLAAEENAASLIPLLADKNEFVRQQVAYALGETRSRAAVAPLIERLSDKKTSVRGAAAVALGQIGDVAAVASLAAILNPQAGLAPTKKKQKSKREQNPFVLRAAARSLARLAVAKVRRLSSLCYRTRRLKLTSDEKQLLRSEPLVMPRRCRFFAMR